MRMKFVYFITQAYHKAFGLRFARARLPKPNFDAVGGRQHDFRLELLLAILKVAVDALEMLQDSHDRVAHLCQREVLPDADSWARVLVGFWCLAE